MFTKNFSPIGPAIWSAIGDIYINVLFYYIDLTIIKEIRGKKGENVRITNLIQFYLALSTTNTNLIMEKNFDKGFVCCFCCWKYFGLRSKNLTPVNSTIEETVQTFIYPGYSL